MSKPKFLKSRVQNEIRRNFPKASIISYKKFDSGLVSPTYKVKLRNPRISLVVKIYKAKNHRLARANETITRYLFSKRFPVPRIYSDTLFKKQEIVVINYFFCNNSLSAYT